MGPARVGSRVNVVEVEKGPLVSKCVVGNGWQGAERLSYEEGMPDLKAIVVPKKTKFNSGFVGKNHMCIVCAYSHTLTPAGESVLSSERLYAFFGLRWLGAGSRGEVRAPEEQLLAYV